MFQPMLKKVDAKSQIFSVNIKKLKAHIKHMSKAVLILIVVGWHVKCKMVLRLLLK